MNDSTNDFRKQREENILALKEDLEAGARQLEFTEDEVARRRIKRRIEYLGRESHYVWGKRYLLK